MRRLSAALTALLSLCWLSIAAPAYAQPEYAQAVSACGTPNNSPVAGNIYPVTMDLTARMCGAVSISGSVAVVGTTSNASSGVATSATNIPNVSYNYNFNGTTWDQAKTLPGVPTTGVGVPAAGLASVFNSTLPTYTNGQYGALQMSSRGALLSGLVDASNGNSIGTMNQGSDGASSSGIGIISSGFGFTFNGSTWDRARNIVGALAAGSAGTGTTAVEEGGSLFSEITSATTTAVKGTPAILHQICVNTLVGASTIKAYNATTATGTPITITLPATITGDNPFCVKYDIYMSTALTVVTSGATDVTVTYR